MSVKDTFVVLSFAVLALIAVATVVFFLLDYKLSNIKRFGAATPLKVARRLRVPACDRCAHCSELYGATVCTCPIAVEYIARLTADRLKGVKPLEVRGSRFCKFVSKEEVG